MENNKTNSEMPPVTISEIVEYKKMDFWDWLIQIEQRGEVHSII